MVGYERSWQKFPSIPSAIYDGFTLPQFREYHWDNYSFLYEKHAVHTLSDLLTCPQFIVLHLSKLFHFPLHDDAVQSTLQRARVCSECPRSLPAGRFIPRCYRSWKENRKRKTSEISRSIKLLRVAHKLDVRGQKGYTMVSKRNWVSTLSEQQRWTQAKEFKN